MYVCRRDTNLLDGLQTRIDIVRDSGIKCEIDFRQRRRKRTRTNLCHRSGGLNNESSLSEFETLTTRMGKIAPHSFSADR